MTRVFIAPSFRGADKGDGGIRRVVEAQHRYLPQFGITVVDSAEEADVLALHAGNWHDRIRPDVPIVAHCHGLYWDGYEWPAWAHELNRDVMRTLRQADVITGPSEWVCQAIRRATWAEAIPLYHGIDPEEWPISAEPHEDYVLWNKTRVDAICDPTPVEKLAALASDTNFITTFGRSASNVNVTGAQPYEDAKRYVRHAGVYLATSRETFGIGTLEAMAAGVPVLGWNWGGQAEFVLHRQHGFLAEPDNYDHLLEGLEYCLRNREELGAAARKYVLEEFTWEQRIAPYAKLYKEIHANQQSRPRVSVVMPYYNLSRYVGAAVDSVLAQKSDDIELIIVNDASQEPLPQEVLRKLPVKHRIINNDTNQYLAEALNTGIRAARGRYILPLDADNMLAPGAIKLLADALDADRSLDVAYGKILFVPEGVDGGREFVSEWPPEEADLASQVAHKNQIPSTAMYRARAWSRVGGYRRRCHTAEDADFWCRVLSTGHVARRVTDAVTFIYNDRQTSMSHTQKDWWWHSWYDWSARKETRLFVAGGSSIPTCEFPEISVVIPVGPGHERLVLDALDSLQAQRFPLWEAIVVNDTGKVLPWLHSWAQEVSIGGGYGAASARNAGMLASKGKYILFLDADDYLHPDALGAMHETLVRNGGSGSFVYSDWFVSETGEVKRTDDFTPDAVLQQLPFSVTCLYSRADIKQHNLYFDTDFDGKGWEDWDFALQAVAKAGLCGIRVPAPLFHYRLRTGTLRDKAYVARDTMKVEIYNKWGDYISGKEKNMASCGGCGGGWRPSAGGGNTSPNTQADPAAGQETVLLEYTSEDTGSRSFIGRVTGNRYYFSTDADHRTRLVYKQDADGLLALGIFRVVVVDTSQEVTLAPLQASGPPQQQVSSVA